MKKLLLYFHTLRRLRWVQLEYQVRYKWNLRFRGQQRPALNESPPPSIRPTLAYKRHRLTGEQAFTFLSLTKSMDLQTVDWNYSGHGKLWTYNLNYFDFIHKMPVDEALQWMKIYAKNTELKDGLEPYPTSLRIMNWIHFCLEHSIREEDLERMIYSDALWLRSNLEYHILANHLLENLLACCLAAVYFDRADWKEEIFPMMLDEWKEQFQSDGAHYEQSPMYHMILTDRMLDLCLLLNAQGEMEHLSSCQKVLQPALNFAVFIHPYGHLPSFNDCAPEVASSLEVIDDKASLLGLSALPPKQAGSSGFRKWVYPNWTVLMDLGSVGPSYQSGHAHADTFSFELFDKQLGPLIVHTGTSTYQPNERRQHERSTAAHNTVSYAGADSSEVWGGFRTASRAEVEWITDEEDLLVAQHDGFKRIGAIHRRAFRRFEQGLEIRDQILGGTKQAQSYLHFHPDVVLKSLDGRLVLNDRFEIQFENFESSALESYLHAQKFNTLKQAQMWSGSFRSHASITIKSIT